MPKLMIPIPDVESMVVRPVVLDVVRQLMEHTRLDENIVIAFPGAEERIPLYGSTINKEGKDVARFPHDNQLIVELTETIQEDGVLTRAVYQPEHVPVVLDQYIGLLVKPVYVHTHNELSFTARFSDRTAAERWLSEMRNKIAMMRDTILHKATYSYTLPAACMGIIMELHRLRENQGGYGENFETYFNQIKAPHVRELTNVGGKIVRTGVGETQQRIIGLFDFREEPEKGGKDGDADAWSISFTYKFEYDKPNAVVMEYPLVVHNQLLGGKYRPGREDKPSVNLQDFNRSASSSIGYLSYFESDYEWLKNRYIRKGISIPDFDEFIPADVPEGTWRMCTYLIGLTEDDKVNLFNIEELPMVEPLDPVIKKFFLEEAPYMTRQYASVFNIQLYQETDRLHESLIRVDQNYDLKATRNLDIRKTYHVRLGIYWDWRLLDKDAKDRLRLNPEVVDRLICGLYPHYCGLPYEKINDRYISLDEMDKIIDTITQRQIDQLRGMKTVQTLFIEALREESNDVPTVEDEY